MPHTQTESSELKRPSIVDELCIEPGTLHDYKLLAQFHYKGSRPGAVTSVLRLTHEAPTVVGRYLKRRDETQIVGVLVRSLPQLACQLRDLATNCRYRGLKPRDAAIMLNREIRTISRVVINPQWRGLGLAVKLVRYALAHPERAATDEKESPQMSPIARITGPPPASLTTSPSIAESSLQIVYTEALAAMGRVSPFFEHAGMTRYERPPRSEEARLLDALRHLNLEPWMLASKDAYSSALHDQVAADFLGRELRRWHRAAHRTSAAELRAMSLEDLIRAARHQLLCQPIYYLYRHEAIPSSSCGLI